MGTLPGIPNNLIVSGAVLRSLGCKQHCVGARARSCVLRAAGYLAEDAGFSLELVQRAAPEPLRVGTGFRHFTVSVPSIEAALSRAEEAGYMVVEGSGWESGEVYIQVSPAL